MSKIYNSDVINKMLIKFDKKEYWCELLTAAINLEEI